jgi:hypothetical protein
MTFATTEVCDTKFNKYVVSDEGMPKPVKNSAKAISATKVAHDKYDWYLAWLSDFH